MFYGREFLYTDVFRLPNYARCDDTRHVLKLRYSTYRGEKETIICTDPGGTDNLQESTKFERQKENENENGKLIYNEIDIPVYEFVLTRDVFSALLEQFVNKNNNNTKFSSLASKFIKIYYCTGHMELLKINNNSK